MAHPYSDTRSEHHDRARGMVERTGNNCPKMARGGHADAAADEKLIRNAIAQHEHNDHPGKPKTKLKFASGGGVEGDEPKHHLAKRARGGHTNGKKGTHVNVIVAPQGGGGGMRPPMPMGQPMAAAPRPAAPPPAAAPPRPPMAPPAGLPPGGGGMPGAGMRPPGVMKRGGGVQKVAEAGVPVSDILRSKRGGNIERARGGKVPMEFGAGSGEGRLEKVKEYGEKPKKG